MEIFLLAFTAGVVASMFVSALVRNFHAIFVAGLMAVALIVLWYAWAMFGVELLADHWMQSPSGVPGTATFSASAASASAETPPQGAAKIQILGQVGDLFGGVNALFAALAFGGVVFAAVIQNKTLELSRRQFVQQTFEPLFFQLLELHREVSVTQFKLMDRISSGGRKLPARAGQVEFQRAIYLLRRTIRLKAVGFSDDSSGSVALQAIANQIYSAFYEVNQDELGPHFRSLYHVFKLIDTSQFDGETKIKYANIARATLGRDQLFLLAVNCLSTFGEGFKPFVENYGLLKHVDRRKSRANIDERIARLCYSPEALLGAKERAAFRRSS